MLVMKKRSTAKICEQRRCCLTTPFWRAWRKGSNNLSSCMSCLILAECMRTCLSEEGVGSLPADVCYLKSKIFDQVTLRVRATSILPRYESQPEVSHVKPKDTRDHS